VGGTMPPLRTRDWPESDKSIHNPSFQSLAYCATPFFPFPLNQNNTGLATLLTTGVEKSQIASGRRSVGISQ
jgi:hypothetical protein